MKSPDPSLSEAPRARSQPRAGKTWWVVSIFIVGIGLTAIAARYLKSVAELDAKRDFDGACREIQIRVQERLDDHERVLRFGAAFFSHEHQISRQEWRQFAERLKVGQTLPGVQGIGYAVLVARDQLGTHTREIRAGGLTDYRVWPDAEREFYTPVIYLEPAEGRNLRAFGYDMFAEPVRREAMERARDRDEAALSGRVTLVQETDVDPQAGALMYVPIYRSGAPCSTVAERRAALIGWVYSPYRMGDLMQGILKRWGLHEPQFVRMRIFDGGTMAPDTLLYDSKALSSGGSEPGAGLTREAWLESGGHRWRLVFHQNGRPGAGIDYSKAWMVMFGGTIVSGLLSGLTWSLANTRHSARQIADGLTAQLRQSEERWKFALEGAGDGVWDWNVVTGEVVFSRQLKAMLGYAENEFGSRLEEWSERVHPEDLARVMVDVKKHLDGETTSYANEHRLRCKDGTWKWILDRGMVVRRNDAGQPLRMIGTHADISERKRAERERELQSEIMKNLAEGINLVRAADGTIVFANPRFEKMFGYEPGELTGRDVAALNAPTEKTPADTKCGILDSLMQTGEWHGEIENIRKDGTRFWCYANVSTFEHAEFGRVFVSVHMDITASKEAEMALRESERRFRRLFEASHAVMLVLDPADGAVVDANPAAVDYYGWTRAELLCKKITEINPLDPVQIAANLKVAQQDRRSYFQFQHRRADRSVRDVEVFTSPINFGGRVMLYAIIHDVTARKEAEASLRATEAKFRAIIHETPVPMALNEGGERNTYVNPAFVATFGYGLDEIADLAQWWPKAYPDPAYRQWVMQNWRSRMEDAARTGNAFVPLEVEVRCKNGTKQIVLVSAAPLLHGFDGSLLVVFTNITAQKEARDALLVSLREKEALLKEVHHRVKNNLQVVTSLLRLETGRSRDPGVRGVLKDMQGRVQTMALLHESLYRSGTYASVDLGAYLHKAVTQLFRSMVAHPGAVRLRTELMSVQVEMDQAIPCGLLVNELVSNSLKHGFPDARTGEVRVELRQAENGERLRLEVSDTGVGLPAGFEAARGRSLGLQLVTDLAGQLGGDLECGPGPAAVFALTFSPRRSGSNARLVEA